MFGTKFSIWLGLLLFCINFSLQAQFDQPFKWNSTVEGNTLTVSAVIPPAHYLYADQKTAVKVFDEKETLKPFEVPKKIKYTDEFGSGDIYPAGELAWKYTILPSHKYKVKVEFQGCKKKTKDSPGICFMPAEEELTPSKTAEKTTVKDAPVDKIGSGNKNLNSLLDQFAVVKTGGGYLNKEEFLEFLSEKKASDDEVNLGNKSTLVVILLVLLGGLALNLTPCVLPMIPINLAIIGAGKSADKKGQGLLRGGVYGVGIALAYGILGVLTVLSGVKFGTLNSAAWFNFLIAAVFIVLALAMFDIFSIDFTKFSTKFGIKQPEKGELIPVFLMGIVAALLAGACVAPVVIAVLLHSTSLYAEGNIAGLILPFVLGVGMALPWPIAGAGLASLPKPGKWMLRVKQVMGGMILLFATYYIFIGVNLLPKKGTEDVDADSSFVALEKALLQAKAEDKPVFIDFWASWCKNCTQMGKTTFKDPEVKKKLESYVFIKFQTEKPSQPDNRNLLDRYQIIGLPGFVILKEKE